MTDPLVSMEVYNVFTNRLDHVWKFTLVV
jgi:hypothetical protein